MSLLNTDHGRSDVPNLLRCLQNEDVVALRVKQLAAQDYVIEWVAAISPCQLAVREGTTNAVPCLVCLLNPFLLVRKKVLLQVIDEILKALVFRFKAQKLANR